MLDIDPKIKVDTALMITAGNQAELARQLGIGRASVNEWLSDKREFLPALQAHRFLKLFPHVPYK